MQTQLKKDEYAWDKLEKILLDATEVNQCFGALAVEENGKVSYCAMGYAAKKAGYSDHTLGSSILFPFKVDILKNYGFSAQERSKKRMCTEYDCKWTGCLSFLITHLNDYHKISIPEIGRRIQLIQNDKRNLPPFWKRLFYNLENFNCY